MINFIATPLTGPTPLLVKFTDTSMSRTILWDWRFGDGEFSKDRDPLHLYEAPGKYSVTLTVTNLNHSFTLTKHDYICVLTNMQSSLT